MAHPCESSESFVSEQTAPVITQIEQLVKDVPGFTPIDQLYTLFTIGILSSPIPGGIVEIGSWCGRSTVPLGLAARLTGNTRVLCIDLFPTRGDWKQNSDGSYSFEVMIDGKLHAGNKEQTVWKEPWDKHYVDLYARYPRIFDAFSETIARTKMQDIVDVHRGDSEILQTMAPNSMRLAFLDGDHGYSAVCKDIRNAHHVLAKGGWICFDDAFSYYDGVNRAITELIIDSPDYDLCQQMTRKLFIARKRQH